MKRASNIPLAQFGGQASCTRCRQIMVIVDHKKPVFHPVTKKLIKHHPYGRVIRRILCNCGCLGADIFFIYNRDAIRTKDTTTLLTHDYFDLDKCFEGSLHGLA